MKTFNFKICLFGNSTVGCTSLIRYYLRIGENYHNIPTGKQYFPKRIIIDNKEIILHLFNLCTIQSWWGGMRWKIELLL